MADENYVTDHLYLQFKNAGYWNKCHLRPTIREDGGRRLQPDCLLEYHNFAGVIEFKTSVGGIVAASKQVLKALQGGYSYNDKPIKFGVACVFPGNITREEFLERIPLTIGEMGVTVLFHYLAPSGRAEGGVLPDEQEEMVVFPPSGSISMNFTGMIDAMELIASYYNSSASVIPTLPQPDLPISPHGGDNVGVAETRLADFDDDAISRTRLYTRTPVSRLFSLSALDESVDFRILTNRGDREFALVSMTDGQFVYNNKTVSYSAGEVLCRSTAFAHVLWQAADWGFGGEVYEVDED